MTRVNDQHTRLSSDLRSALQIIDGDIVQAVQALKETNPDPQPDLERRLMNLIKELGHYKRVHDERDSGYFEYPFRRGERQVNDVFKAIFPDLTPPLAKSRTKTPMLLNINTQSHFETFALGPYQFPRLLNGLWQLSSSSWGSGSDKRQEEELIRLVQSGFTAADMADHYVCPTPCHGGG